jgi:Flp pilus assembly protein TadG
MRLFRLLRRFRQREEGNASVEFVVLVPLLFSIFFAALENGLMMIRWTAIDRASDMVIRQLRLGQLVNPTAQSLRQGFCDRTLMITDCVANTVVEIRRIDRTTFVMPAPNAPCANRTTSTTILPVTTITPGQANDLMLIRICVSVDALIPEGAFALPLTLDAQGGYALSVASVYVNEPN